MARPDSRLRAAILLPNGIEDAMAEVERLAPDPRFVQAMVLCMNEMPLGRREYWPLHAALERHGLPLGIMPAARGGTRRPRSAGPLACRGICLECVRVPGEPRLAGHRRGVQQVPRAEGRADGIRVSWLPAFLWRLTKSWKGVRFEIPWIDRSPAEILRDHVRLTIRPFDAPRMPRPCSGCSTTAQRRIAALASDWPHAHFAGDDTLPPGFPQALLPKIMVENPRATYSRLREGGNA